MADRVVLSGPERDALIRNDFAAFVQEFFPLVAPGVKLSWAPYLDLLCAWLGDAAMGRSADLIINMPPRHLKSICVSVLLPAFFLAHFPGKEIMCVSYSQDLAQGFAELTRKVMLSERYRELFETRLANPRANPRALRTVQGGVRRATSLDGTATGRGADRIVFDDPQKPGDALSDTVRATTNAAFANTFLSRRNDPADSVMVVVMQRLHEDDFTGHLLAGGGDWAHLTLPAIAEQAEVETYQTVFGLHQYRRKSGEPLHPTRIPLAELERIRLEMGEATWTSQYQQRPAPPGGGVIKECWFGRYRPEHLPVFDRIVQSWDTANKTSQLHDFSVCTTWGEKGSKRWLLHVYRGRVNYPDLKRMVLQLAETHAAHVVVIEDKGSGTQLLQELPELGFYKAKASIPAGDKKMRMANQAALIESGAVSIPEEASWLNEWLHELAMFPNARFDDQVDSTSQALAFMTTKMPGQGILEFYRLEAEAIRGEGPRKITRVSFPLGGGMLSGMDGRLHVAEADGFIHLDDPRDLGVCYAGKGWAIVPDDVVAAPGSFVDIHGYWPGEGPDDF